jgi:ABC-2 type transport system permease protein
MNHYIKVYKALLKLNISNLFAYRVNFINSLISSLGYGLLSFLIIILITSQTPVVFGWKREELILMMGVYNILVGGVYAGLISRNFDRFAENVDFGRLDSLLLKPISAQFLLSCKNIAYVQVVRAIMGFSVVVYMLNKLNLKVSIFQLILFLLMSVFSLVLLYSLWYLVMTLTIWNTKLSNLTDLMYRLNDLSRFPPKMYDGVKNFFIFIIPYMFIIVVPVKIILNKVEFFDIFCLIFFAIFMSYISHKFWNFALRYYTGASS